MPVKEALAIPVRPRVSNTISFAIRPILVAFGIARSSPTSPHSSRVLGSPGIGPRAGCCRKGRYG